MAYVLNWLQNLHVAYTTVPVLKVLAKPGIPNLSDLPNLPTSYSLPKNHLAKDWSETLASGYLISNLGTL